MADPVLKTCPRCNRPFECNQGNITRCQCFAQMLKPDLRSWLEQRYTGCLCSDCLRELQQDQDSITEKPVPGKDG